MIKKTLLVYVLFLSSITDVFAFACSDIHQGNLNLPSVDAGVLFNNNSPIACNSDSMIISGTFMNYGGLVNFNAITVNAGGSLVNNSGAEVTNLGIVENYGYLSNSGRLEGGYTPINNYGTLVNTGLWNTYIGQYSINNFSNGSVVNSGEMRLGGVSNNLGTITNNANLNLSDGYGGNYAGSIQGAGTIVNNGVINVPFAASINAAGITNNGSIVISGLGNSRVTEDINGTGSLTIRSAALDAGFGTLTVIGNLIQSTLSVTSGSLTVAGVIENNVLVGNAELGQSNYAGVLNAPNINGDLTIHTNGVVNGLKSVTGNVSVIGGKLSSFDSMTIYGGLSTTNSSEIDFLINGTSTGSFSFIKIKGSASFSGGLLNINFDEHKPQIGETWEIMSSDGGIAGLDSLILSGVASAYPNETTQLLLTTLNGNLFVTVTAVPEQNTYAMLLAGMGILGFVVRRKKG